MGVPTENLHGYLQSGDQAVFDELTRLLQCYIYNNAPASNMI